MKILANRHVGILVHNMDAMIEFYTGLGMTMKGYGRMIEKGKFIDTILNADKCILETTKLTIEDNDLPEKYWFVLELMSLHNDNKSSLDSTPDKLKFDINNHKKGVLDIAFTVDNIYTVSEYVVNQGGSLIGAIEAPPKGYPSLHCYLHDIEGNVLHIAQNIKH